MFKHNASVAPSSLDNIVNVGLNNSTQAIFSEISIFDELKIFQHPFVKKTLALGDLRDIICPIHRVFLLRSLPSAFRQWKIPLM